MVLLITADHVGTLCVNDFNTSHVSINPISEKLPSQDMTDFNTSHVSINPNDNEWDVRLMVFQYISCFY